MGLPWGKIKLLTNIFDFFCCDPKRLQTSLHRAPKPKSGRKKTKLWIEGENKVTKTDITYLKKIYTYIYIYRQYVWYIFTVCMCILHVCVCVQPTYDNPSTSPPTSIPYPQKRRKKWLRNQGELDVPCNQAVQLESYLIIRNLGLKLIIQKYWQVAFKANLSQKFSAFYRPKNRASLMMVSFT